jgi:hypothetical protein
MSQKRLIEELLKLVDFEECKPVATPMDPSIYKNLMLDSEEDEEVVDFPYREVVGKLLFLLNTRPDLSFAVGVLARFFSTFKRKHVVAVKRVLRYLKGTIDFGLVYTKTDMTLVGFVDSSYGDCLKTRKSTYGYGFYIGNNLLSWRSKKEEVVAGSTGEAEVVALYHGCLEACYLGNILEELGFGIMEPTVIYCDNNAAISFGNGLKMNSRMKNMEIKYFKIQEQQEENKIKVAYIKSENNVVDIFTKPLERIKFEEFRKALGVLEVCPVLSSGCVEKGIGLCAKKPNFQIGSSPWLPANG